MNKQTKGLSVEELLKPRYKVVSDWPGRKDFEVGQVIVLDKKFSPQFQMYEIEDCQGKRQYINSFFEMFPLQFKKLQWWEERDKSTMPKYVKFPEGHHNIEKGGVVEVFNWYKYPDACIFHNHINAGWMLPATETEYNDYLKTKKP